MTTTGQTLDDEADRLQKSLGVGPDDLRRDLADAMRMRNGRRPYTAPATAFTVTPEKPVEVQMREVAYEALVTYLANRPDAWWKQDMPAIEKEMFAVARAIAYADDLLSDKEV